MKSLEERGGVKSLPGIDTEIPADVELTEMAFDVLRKAEDHGFANFEVSSQQLETVSQLADICSTVGHKLIRQRTDDEIRELIRRGVTLPAGRYILLTDGALKEAKL